MAYADFGFYRDSYQGNSVPEADFPRLAQRASEYMDADSGGLTATAAGAALDAVRRCCCAVAELLYRDEQAASGGASSGAVLKAETVGSWRREYELSGDAAKPLSERVYDIEKRYLGPWGLLYRGVRPCVH